MLTGFRAIATVGATVLTLTGAPLSAEDLSPEQQLGRMLYLDPNLSLHRNQSCNTCHALQPATVIGETQAPPTPGFVDPDNVGTGSAVSAGSPPGTKGALNTPSAGYAMFSPPFHWDADEGLYIGGQFWNGRANSLADQAKGPPLNPVEMAMPSEWAVVTRLRENPVYVERFRAIYAIDLDRIPGKEAAPAGDSAPEGVHAGFQAMAEAIAAFEKSRVFNRFTSKYDFVMAGLAELTEQERIGLELFNSEKSQCAECHVTTPSPVPGGQVLPPLFTDFSFDNLGLPRNVNIPGNPAPDLGLGGRADIAARDPQGAELGKQKVMGLRNIDLTPPYMHNGALRTLKQVVHFYNTRDTKPRVCADLNDPGFGRDCWPEPEVSQNVNTDELGDLGLSEEDELALVAFMQTLTDGYPDWGGDPRVPPGTPSPYAEVPLPPAP